ncbi:MAG TPA: nuclear transport factor 2 family protein [Longimicrobium sp.]|jgi:hypothetical protein|uniref:nuclear transport factor 2 family protein n=1 Tax=Longimicrobium sp. TaxID=2029185 RepID=UPI002EDB27E8
MRILRLLALTLALVAGDRSLAAQDTPEQQEVRAVVDRMFDAMRAGDSTALRPLFHPTARLQSVGVREGRTMLRGDSIDPFIRAVGTPHDKVWDERISEVEIRVDGPLATAWMNYAFYLGDQFSHCGVNAFQFVRMEAGWQIIQITDTRRRECPWSGQAARP